MKNTQALILAGAAALLLLRKPIAHAAGTAGQAQAATTANTAASTSTASTRAYFDPVALAGQAANAVLSGLGIVKPTTVAGATANPDQARAAVRAGDDYYGTGALAWFASNTDEARIAVRAGDTYYTTADTWRVSQGDTVGGSGFLSDAAASAFYGDGGN